MNIEFPLAHAVVGILASFSCGVLCVFIRRPVWLWVSSITLKSTNVMLMSHATGALLGLSICSYSPLAFILVSQPASLA